MKSTIVIACVFGILVSVTLLILSIYALTVTTQLSIPLPALTSTLSLLLPILTPGISFFQIRNSNRKKYLRLTQFIFLATMILDTILLTYAVSALDPSFLSCQLETQWRALFTHKNGASIRTIQDRLECCGFKTLLDRAWPFPSDHEKHGADACVRAFPRRGMACMNGLISEERKVLGIMIAIGGVSLLSKLLFFLLLQFFKPVWFSRIRGSSGEHVLPSQYTDNETEHGLPSSRRRERQAGSGEGVGDGIAVPRRQITDRSHIDDDGDSVDVTEGGGARRQQPQQRRENEGGGQEPLISLEREEWSNQV